MKQNRIFHRALSLFLLVAILAGFAVPIRATKASSDLRRDGPGLSGRRQAHRLPAQR